MSYTRGREFGNSCVLSQILKQLIVPEDDKPFYVLYVTSIVECFFVPSPLLPVAMRNGLLIRTAVRRRNSSLIIISHALSWQVIGAIFRKSLRLSGSARKEHSVGQITTMVSSDSARLDVFSAFIHEYALIF